ncbi:hypothetical protein IAE22_34570, partial [Bacillus sp. S34]|nr:hypothetical protein [Bacillus sp. S34]
VRVFGREGADKRILLLFSSADAYTAMVPDEKIRQVMVYDGPRLEEFLTAHLESLEGVFFDIAGPSENKGGGYGWLGKGATGVMVRTLI